MVKCLSNDFLDKLSLSLGEIPPGGKSEIHLHPFVTQVTFVLRGNISILMKSPGKLEPTTLKLSPHESVVTPVNTFFQLANESQDETCEVLYIVNPAFLFLLDKQGNVKFNDALILGNDWHCVDKALQKIDLQKFLQERQQLKLDLQDAS